MEESVNHQTLLPPKISLWPLIIFIALLLCRIIEQTKTGVYIHILSIKSHFFLNKTKPPGIQDKCPYELDLPCS